MNVVGRAAICAKPFVSASAYVDRLLLLPWWGKEQHKDYGGGPEAKYRLGVNFMHFCDNTVKLYLVRSPGSMVVYRKRFSRWSGRLQLTGIEWKNNECVDNRIRPTGINKFFLEYVKCNSPLEPCPCVMQKNDHRDCNDDISDGC